MKTLKAFGHNEYLLSESRFSSMNVSSEQHMKYHQMTCCVLHIAGSIKSENKNENASILHSFQFYTTIFITEYFIDNNWSKK